MKSNFMHPAIFMAFFTLTGCSQSEPEGAGAEVSAVTTSERLTSASAFYRAQHCDTAIASDPPRAGRVFHYTMSSSGENQPLMTRAQPIRSVSGDMVNYDEVLGMGEMSSPPESRQARLGLLLTASTGRSIRYDGAEDAIKGLQSGHFVKIPMTETLSDSDATPAQGEAVVTFVGCGVTHPTVTGAPGEPVRLYRLKMPHAAPQAPGQMTEVTELEILLSQRYGWPVVESVSGGTMVLTSVSN